MQLVGARLDAMWTCPVHAVILERKGGQCPIDHRDLVQLVVAVSWSCKDRPDVNELEPGKCADGSERAIKYTPRIHGDHNPRHGGQFFMAADNYHHLEGAVPSPGRFRVYLYDSFTKPLPRVEASQVKGRVVTKETFDPKTRATNEVAFPLTLSKDGLYLEGPTDTRTFPATLTAKLVFKSGAPEYRFDFTFASASKEPVAPASTATNRPVPQSSKQATTAIGGRSSGERRPRGSDAQPAVAPALAASAQSAPASAPQSPPPDFNVTGNLESTIRVTIPESTADVIAEMRGRGERIRALIAEGAFDQVFVPAFEAKELAMALDLRTAEWAAQRRSSASTVVSRLVRCAWLLDAAGDVGDRSQLLRASDEFEATVRSLADIFSVAP
jgi:hypothetical protein